MLQQLLTILIETLPLHTHFSFQGRHAGGEGPQGTLAGVCSCPQGSLGPEARASGPFQQFICKFSQSSGCFVCTVPNIWIDFFFFFKPDLLDVLALCRQEFNFLIIIPLLHLRFLGTGALVQWRREIQQKAFFFFADFFTFLEVSTPFKVGGLTAFSLVDEIDQNNMVC